MANVLIEEQTMKDIANGIRTLTGKTDLMMPVEMISELEGLEGSIGGDSNDEVLISFIERTATEVVIPNGVTQIGKYLFYNNTTLEKLTMSDTVIKTDYRMCDSCSALNEVVFSKNLSQIGDYSFRNCSKLVVAELSESITYIGQYAFNGCKILQLTKLPSNLKTINSSAFGDCTNLAITELPEALTTLNGFYNCPNITIKKIPKSVTSVSSQAFYKCTGLTEMTFEGTPNSIYNNVFSGCDNLTVIRVPWSEDAVKNAPWGATNATIIYDYVEGE